MKGIIFTELLRYLEQIESDSFVDAILQECALPDGGVFIRAGSYPAAHALLIMEKASERMKLPLADLGRYFGRSLFGRFTVIYPDIMGQYTNALDLLAHVGSHIHIDITVLYPDARPPRIWHEEKDGQTTIHYQSHRPMAAIALGLIEQCMEHFGDGYDVILMDDAKQKRAGFELRPVANAGALAA
jgi:Haem-NO-binding